MRRDVVEVIAEQLNERQADVMASFLTWDDGRRKLDGMSKGKRWDIDREQRAFDRENRHEIRLLVKKRGYWRNRDHEVAKLKAQHAKHRAKRNAEALQRYLAEATEGSHGDILLMATVISSAHEMAAGVAAETTEARFLHGKTCGRQGRKPRKVRQALERQAVRTALAKHLEPYVTPPWWAPPGSLSPLVPQLEPDGSAVDWHAAKGHVGSLEGCADYWCFKKNGDDIRRSASAALSIGLLAAMKEDARREGAR